MQKAIPEPLRQALAALDAEAMLATVRALCRPELGGRATGSPGQARARRWLMASLRRLGLRPELHRFQVRTRQSLGTATVVWTPLKGPARSLRRWVDFTEHPRSAPVPAPARGPLKVWDGRTVPRDAWVLLSGGEVRRGELLATLAAEGALGVVVPRRAGPDGWLAKHVSTGPVLPLPVLTVRADLAQHLTGGMLEVALPGSTEQVVRGANILARFPGAIGEALVLIGAHYDGVGDDTDGTRFPGASDNATGVAVVLEVARILARVGRPDGLQLAFAFFDAEELGARGSRSLARMLARSAPVRPGCLVQVINVDTVARLRDAVWVEGGPGADPLLAALDRAGRALDIPLQLGPVASDNRAFAAAGFPAVGIATGGDRSHLPSDVPGVVEPEALLTAARLLLGALWMLTDQT